MDQTQFKMERIYTKLQGLSTKYPEKWGHGGISKGRQKLTLTPINALAPLLCSFFSTIEGAFFFFWHLAAQTGLNICTLHYDDHDIM